MINITEFNRSVWTAFENSLTPLPHNSKESRLYHHLPAIAYGPLGILTFCLDTIKGFVRCNKTQEPEGFPGTLTDSRKWKQIDNLEVSFDSKTLFGAATCTYQDSGSVNCPNSQWVQWEEKVLPENNRSGRSADLFTLYQSAEGRKEITDRLHKLGVNSYRFSVEWSHLEPSKDRFNDLNLQIYVDLCKHLQDEDITPMVTFHHFSEPLWFHELGSFEKEDNIPYFISFINKVSPALTSMYKGKPLVNYFCTINEPNIEAFSRYVRGAFSPGLTFNFTKAGMFLKNALKAHTIAYSVLKKIEPQVQIGIIHQRLSMIAANPLLILVTRYLNRLNNEVTLQFFKTGTFTYKMPFCCHIEEENLYPKTDFVGLQYYGRPVIGLTGSTSYHEPMTEMPFREDPEGIYEAILEVYDAFKCPVIITENGISTHDETQRTRYMERALYATHQAQKEIGSENLLGYYVWTFCEPNLEWDMGMRPQSFGAFGVDNNGVTEKQPKEGAKPFIQTAERSRKNEESNQEVC